MNSADLLTLGDFEQAARNKLDDAIWAYVAGGAGEERTVKANLAAFDEVWLRRRIASIPGGRPQTAVSILGCSSAIPVLLAPTSPVKILHPDAELACGRAAQTLLVSPEGPRRDGGEKAICTLAHRPRQPGAAAQPRCHPLRPSGRTAE